MTVRITEGFDYAYDGFDVRAISEGQELPDDDQAAVWALANDRGEEVEEDDAPVNISRANKTQLLEVAAERGIEASENLTKAQIRELLEG